jgi:hypothetical protein
MPLRLRLQGECEAHMWEHCPATAHQFAVYAQHLDARSCAGLAPELKWRSILVRRAVPLRAAVAAGAGQAEGEGC